MFTAVDYFGMSGVAKWQLVPDKSRVDEWVDGWVEEGRVLVLCLSFAAVRWINREISGLVPLGRVMNFITFAYWTSQ